jgi:hypothetical protein
MRLGRAQCEVEASSEKSFDILHIHVNNSSSPDLTVKSAQSRSGSPVSRRRQRFSRTVIALEMFRNLLLSHRFCRRYRMTAMSSGRLASPPAKNSGNRRGDSLVLPTGILEICSRISATWLPHVSGKNTNARVCDVLVVSQRWFELSRFRIAR